MFKKVKVTIKIKPPGWGGGSSETHLYVGHVHLPACVFLHGGRLFYKKVGGRLGQAIFFTENKKKSGFSKNTFFAKTQGRSAYTNSVHLRKLSPSA